MKLRKLVPSLLCVVAVVLSVSVGAENREAFFQPGKVRALILTGRNNHDWRLSSQYLENALVQSQRFDARVVEEPEGITSRTLSAYQVIILDYQGPRWGETTEKAILQFVEKGGGLVIVHGASYGFSGLDVLGDGHVRTGLREPPWKEYLQLIGGVWSEQDPVSAHGDRHTFRVRFADRQHPVTAGLPEQFLATDELYHNLRMHPSAHVIATAFSHPSTRGTGEDEPILWSVDYGLGRVFHTTLGHDLVAMAEPGFRITFLRGAEWAATGLATLPPSTVWNEPVQSAPRVLVVTGGHDYHTGFYTLFDGDWLTWSHVSSNREAFQKDLRESYDVLVLYDMNRELPEEGKRHLTSFVESGKGLVILHHALADYNSWTWWWKEVVGCRFTLEGGAEEPSTYEHDVEIRVRSVSQHPITVDLGPFHYVEETYGKMWFSPENQVLMQADHEGGAGPVVWISPYESSRVVGIQLGHDQRAFRYPGFRDLVKRSILWSAVGKN